MYSILVLMYVLYFSQRMYSILVLMYVLHFSRNVCIMV